MPENPDEPDVTPDGDLSASLRATRASDPLVTIPPPDEQRSLIPGGTVLEGTYRVDGLLGRGAMGAVYRAHHVTLDKPFAVKVLGGVEDEAPSPQAVERLIREARVTSALEHEHIVRVTHLGQTDEGLPFLVMELLEGESLREHHLRVGSVTAGGLGPLPDETVRRIVPELLDGLAAAHDAGVLHRDLKPDNLFLHERAGRTITKIVDFGMSRAIDAVSTRLTASGQIVGTPLYLSPEQGKANAEVDGRSDIYAVGVIVYEMLAGRVPFPGGSVFEIVFKHISEAPPPLGKFRPDLPPAVVELVHRALEKDPDARFENARAMRDAWDRAWPAKVEAKPDPEAAKAELGLAATLNLVPDELPQRPLLEAREPDRSPPSPLDIPPAPAVPAEAAQLAATVSASPARPVPDTVESRVVPPPSPPQRPGPPVLLIAGAALLLAVGAGALLATRGGPTEPPARQAEEAPAPLVATPTPVPTGIVHLESDPPGAEVRHAGESLGTTPLEVTLPGGEDDYVVQVEAEGYLLREVRLRRDGPTSRSIELHER